MILYLDTSALIKLYVNEKGTDIIYDEVEKSDIIATSTIAYAETRAAFMRLKRENYFDQKDYLSVVNAFEMDFKDYLAVEVSDKIIKATGKLVEKYPLHGFDAIHLASAVFLLRQTNEKVVSACWDKRLREAFKDNMDVIPDYI